MAEILIEDYNGDNIYDIAAEFNDINGNGILNSSVLVRKDLLEEVGLISCDINKITWEDYDCWLRISRKTNRFYY